MSFIEHDGIKFFRFPSGNIMGFSEARRKVESAQRALSRSYSRAFKLAQDDYDYEHLDWELDNVQSWLNHVRQHLAKTRGDMPKRERIARLRDVSGRTPEEATLFLEKADQLERELEA